MNRTKLPIRERIGSVPQLPIGIEVTVAETLIEDEPEKYQTHFSLYAKKGIDADNIDELYKKVHAAIRADPTVKKSEKQQPKEHKRYNLKKLTYDERKNKLIERLNALNNVAGADDDEEDDD